MATIAVTMPQTYSTGMVLPGRFYASIWIGMLIPWQIALNFGGVDR